MWRDISYNFMFEVAHCAEGEGQTAAEFRSVYQLVLQGIASQLSVGLHVHLFQNPPSISTHCLDAEVEGIANLRKRLAFGDSA